MAGAAQRSTEPGPGPLGRSGLKDKAEQVLDANLKLIMDIDAWIGELRAKTGDGCPAVVAELRALSREVVWKGLHDEELRGELATFAAAACREEIAWKDGYDSGQAAAAATAPLRPRHARARTSHLKLAGVAAAFTAATAGGTAATMMTDSASVHHYASPSPAAVLRQAPADTATLIPSFSPPARPSTAAKSAQPAVLPPAQPTVPVTADPSPGPSSPPPAPPPPDLTVPSVLPLGASTRGVLVLTAGNQAVQWSLNVPTGITASLQQGFLAAGQSVTIQISDLLGVDSWAYVSFGGTTTPVHIVSSLGLPSLP